MTIQDDAAGFFSKAVAALCAFLRVLLLLLLGLLLSASLLLAIASNGVRLSLLDANFYVAQLDKAGAYEFAKDTIVNSSVESLLADAPFDDAQKQNLSVELTAGFSEAIPTSWVKVQADGLIRNSFAYAKSETTTLNLNISTVELKPSLKAAVRKLAPKVVQVAVTQEVARNNSSQIAAANEYFANGGVGPGGCASIEACLQYCMAHEDDCQSLNISQEQIASAIGKNGSEAAAVPNDPATTVPSAGTSQGLFDGLDKQVDTSVPDTIDLDALANHKPSEELAKVREPLATALLACNLLIVLCIVLALLQSAVAWSVTGALRHVGIPLLITSAIACTASFLAPNTLLDLVAKNLPTAGSTPQVNEIALQVVQPLLRGYFETTLVLSIVVGVLGLAMIALSFVVERNEQAAKAQETGKQQPQ